MDTVIFHCSECRVALSRPVLPLVDRELLSEEVGSDHVPTGHYLLSEGEFRGDGGTGYILNKADVVNTIHHATDEAQWLLWAGRVWRG
jgi:hypothetical protein